MGPRLWAKEPGPDGVLGRKPGRSDALEWQCSDFGRDGPRPSDAGPWKAAHVYQAFVKGDPSSHYWLVKP